MYHYFNVDQLPWDEDHEAIINLNPVGLTRHIAGLINMDNSIDITYIEQRENYV
jgi:hypothetical protein